MFLFLFTYFAIYGGAHLYLLSRTVTAFGLGAPFPAILAVVAAFMVLAPILVRVLERMQLERAARLTAYLGYLWMGLFFLYLSASLALDIVRVTLGFSGWVLHRNLLLTETRILATSFGIAVAASIYGFFEARRLKVERVILESPKVPARLGRFRIVQLSDVHLGLMVGKGTLRRILERVTQLTPDLLVSTGDLVDGQMDGLRGMEEEFRRVSVPYGKFAVLGNHEVFAGVGPSAGFTRGAGFHLLQGESFLVADFIAVAGVDDPALFRGTQKGSNEGELLSGVSRDRFTLLLKHRPSVAPESVDLFDLQLSGHVHKGQIFPFNLLTHLAYPAPMGLSRTGSSFLYVSRGTGTWGPPLRVLAPPEITVIDLVPPSE